MLEALNFVRGAVAKKDLVPVLTHFFIRKGRIQGGNGRIYIDAPIPGIPDIDIVVPADRFLKAVDACDGSPVLKITPTGKLSIKKKSFAALLPLGDVNTFPASTLSSAKLPTTNLLQAMQALRSFVGEDASRPWACGVLFRDNFAYATNNVVLCRIPVVWNAPPVNIPYYAIDELLRINEDPTELRISDTAIDFIFGDRWLKAQLFDLNWPDLSSFFVSKAETTLDKRKLIAAINKVLPFCPDPKFPVIKFTADGVSTADGDMSASMGGLSLPTGSFRAEPLLLVLNKSVYVDFKAYPDASKFAGENGLEGVMVGVNV